MQDEGPPLLRLLEGFPVSVCESAESGRRLVAARALAEGELVLVARPAGRVMSWAARKRWCAHCHGLSATAALRIACRGCDLFFCSRACASAAAAAHSPAWCALRAGLRSQQAPPTPRLSEEAAMLSQLLLDCLASDTQPADEGLRVEPGAAPAPRPRLLDLLALYTPAPASLAQYGLSEWTTTWAAVAEALLVAAPEGGGPLSPLATSRDALAALLGEVASKDLSNSFGLFDRTRACAEARFRSGGHGLFPAGALLNHSCLPSLYHVHQRAAGAGGGAHAALVFRAIRPLQAGEELTIRYTDGGDFERRAVFEGTWGFSCGCQRCVGEEEARAAAGADWDARYLCGCGYGRPGGGPGHGRKPRSRSDCACPTPWLLPPPARPRAEHCTQPAPPSSSAAAVAVAS